jgi:release factor glutamine methyltransferase
MKQRIFTLRQIIEEGTAVLEAAGIEEAALDAWYLLEYTAGISRASYYGDPGRILEERQAKQYLEYIQMRSKRIPLQHITGEQEFMGYPFYVNEHVLIPRQDTETLVEEAVKIVRAKMRDMEGRKSLRILDMCTGSGCILLSIMKMCPLAEGVGCDISEEALKTAGKNAKRLGVNAKWIRSDLFERWDQPDQGNCAVETSVGKEPVRSGSRYDVIVSNPPYIPTEDIEGLQEEVRFHDPRIALDGGEDGLHFYRRIIEDSISHIEDGGYLLFEIGCGQGKDVAELMEVHGYENVMIKKDLSGLDRVAAGRYNGERQ